jgi:EF-P beta-lysylation protein EpmB
MTEVLPVYPVDSWQTQLREVITSVDALLLMLRLEREQVGYSEAADRQFPLRVPLAFARRMRTGDPRDPLLMQVLASADELQAVPGYLQDPVGETGDANPRRGIIQKYQGRVLLMVASGCAVNCRYCFRRHFPYGENNNSRSEWRDALAYIGEDPNIKEVIFSGGDPLIANDRLLAELVSQIAAFPHVRRLRIHSRLPVVLPDRVTPGLLDAICHPHLQTVAVIHANHGNEIDRDVIAAVAAMRERFAAGVLPYYLHLLDKVAGAAHFDLPEKRARHLLGEVAASLPGYLVPRLVREETGSRFKTGIGLLT